MFFTISKRTPLNVLSWRTDRDVSGWTVNADNAIVFGSKSAALSRATHDSRTESATLVVTLHDGACILTAVRQVVAEIINGKVSEPTV
jgi:hypothetical protein